MIMNHDHLGVPKRLEKSFQHVIDDDFLPISSFPTSLSILGLLYPQKYCAVSWSDHRPADVGKNQPQIDPTVRAINL